MGIYREYATPARAGAACGIAAAALCVLAIAAASDAALALAVPAFVGAALLADSSDTPRTVHAPVSLAAAVALVCVPQSPCLLQLAMGAVFASCCMALASACGAGRAGRTA